MRLRTIFMVLALVVIVPIVALAGCAMIRFGPVSDNANGPDAAPAVLGTFAGDPIVEHREAWTVSRAPILRNALQDYVYGKFPAPVETSVEDQRVIDQQAFGGLGQLEELTLRIGSGPDAMRMSLVLVTPIGASSDPQTPLPVIVMGHFCGNRVALDREDVSPPLSDGAPCGGGNNGLSNPIVTYVFGEYVASAPTAEILQRGYAAAFIYPPDLVPDNGELAPQALDRFASLTKTDKPVAAIAAWAWAYSRAIDILDKDPRFDPNKTALYGHSRFGKSVLLTAVFDERVDLVLSHQSGTGGATLSRSYMGESVGQITESYPHWFAPAYTGYAKAEDDIPVDQHQLVALVAPRPVLLGNGRHDRWSDPEGAFRAAAGADPVYELFGSQGLDQINLADFNPTADLAYYLGPAGHGVTANDWDAFLAFTDHHFLAE